MNDTATPSTSVRSAQYPYRIRNWQKYQHYSGRRMLWVKVYTGLLNDLQWHDLDGDAAKGLINLLLLAAEYDGDLPNVDTIAFRLRTTTKSISSVISKLSHWIEPASNLLASGYQVACLDKEKEEYRKDRDREACTKATRLSEDWTPQDLTLAHQLLGLEATQNEILKFRDYWIARADRGAIKLDWERTWRNWVRRAADDRRKVNGDYRRHHAATVQSLGSGGVLAALAGRIPQRGPERPGTLSGDDSGSLPQLSVRAGEASGESSDWDTEEA